MRQLFEEMIVNQQKKLLKIASEIVPNITSDDILQPNDFPALENHPFFRYEEGVLEGIQACLAAYCMEEGIKRLSSSSAS
ncbi:MAG: hypothetical protein K9M07_06965 [Simkaniaceae bacterium]|nr:hypothetical protein [Simkaniaceae bacterium]